MKNVEEEHRCRSAAHIAVEIAELLEPYAASGVPLPPWVLEVRAMPPAATLERAGIAQDTVTRRRLLHGHLVLSDQAPYFQVVAACPTCRAELAIFRDWQARVHHPAAQVAPELQTAVRTLWPLLSEMAQDERFDAVLADDLFHHWGLCVHLLEQAHRARFSDKRAALHYAELAAEISQHLPPDDYGWELAADLEARAFAVLGNAHRGLEALGQAEVALARAEEARLLGTDRPELAARIESYLASLRTDQERYEEALEHLDLAEKLYADLGDPHQVGLVVAKKARVLHRLGDAPAHLSSVAHAKRLIDPSRDPALAALLSKNLVAAYLDLGEVHQARRQYQACPEPAEPLLATHYRWVGARLLRAEGRLSWAASALREVLAALRLQDSSLSVAIASLELAAILVELDQTTAAQDVAIEALPALIDTRHHALQEPVMILTRLTSSPDHLSAGSLEDLAAYLRRLSA